jgi:tryptophan-rich sensory protein
MRLFGLNIALNALWPLLFFGMRSPGLGYVEIIVLWVSLAVLVVDTWKFDRVASVLLIPYLLWITIASILNFFVWFIN